MSHPPGFFAQPPPRLGNQYDEDRTLRSTLRRVLPADALAAVEPGLRELGELAGGELYAAQLADRLNEPVLTPWNAWGERVDAIEPTPLWRRAAVVAVEHGLVATAYERALGDLARVEQLARIHLFTPSTDIYSCPLAMTDGAARTLLDSGHRELVARALPRLVDRDPATAWTSGQWMTESTGGSDVSASETVAREADGAWRLYGRKWFTSATTSPMALALARPEGNPAGSRGLALFYVETRGDDGRFAGLRVLRLKDKLGTRKLPTAELELDGVVALPVAGLTDGVRAIAPMLNVTRLWNGASAVALMRRGLALAVDYARRRRAFGATLAEKPLHVDTLAGLQAELEGAFQLVFRVGEVLGAVEGGGGDPRLLRALTPLAKLTTGKQAVAVLSEVLEAFGGAGYVEDTGLPTLLRDAQVLPIWEGTTNVLALDALRVLASEGGLAAVVDEIERALAGADDPSVAAPVAAVRSGVASARGWLERAGGEGRDALEAGARRLALTLGRCLELALLVGHARWALAVEGDARPAAAARRLAANGVDLVRADVEHSDVERRDAALVAGFD